jgi:hypothetical protein
MRYRRKKSWSDALIHVRLEMSFLVRIKQLQTMWNGSIEEEKSPLSRAHCGGSG